MGFLIGQHLGWFCLHLFLVGSFKFWKLDFLAHKLEVYVFQQRKFKVDSLEQELEGLTNNSLPSYCVLASKIDFWQLMTSCVAGNCWVFSGPSERHFYQSPLRRGWLLTSHHGSVSIGAMDARHCFTALAVSAAVPASTALCSSPCPWASPDVPQGQEQSSSPSRRVLLT